MSYAAAHRPHLDQVGGGHCFHVVARAFRFLISGPGATCPLTSEAGVDRETDSSKERGKDREGDRTEAGTEGARGE